MGLLNLFRTPTTRPRRRLPAEALTDLSSVELYDHLSEVIKLREGDLDALYYVRSVVNHLIFRKTEAVQIGNGQAGSGPRRERQQQGDGDRNQNHQQNHKNNRR